MTPRKTSRTGRSCTPSARRTPSWNCTSEGWEGHLRQYTEAKTVEVPLAREGMYFREFPTHFDWMHNGEGFTAFFLQGLSDPYDRALLDRTRRFAGFYMDEDALAKNYDPEHKLIRSMFNGSRGTAAPQNDRSRLGRRSD